MTAEAQSEEAFPRREVAAATALCALFMGALWWRNGPFLDSDEAIVGLMARHMLKGEFPVYYWGQEYMGSVEALLAAGLFAVAGSSVQALKLVPVLFTVATVPIAADLGRLAAGRRGAICAGFAFAIPPVAFALWSIKTRGGFTEPAQLGFWLLWMALRLVRSEHRREAWAAAMGLCLGVGLWWSYFVVPYAAVALAVLALHPRGRDWRVWAIGVGCTLLGAAPAIYRNAFVTHWATVIHAVHPDVSQARAGQPDHPVPREALGRLLGIGLPAMLGFHDARVAPFRFSLPSGLAALGLIGLALAGLAAAVARAGRAPGREARLAAGGALVGALLMALLYVFSRFGYEPEPRYLLTLWLGVGWCYAFALLALWRLHPAAALAACALLYANHLHWTFARETPVQLVQWRPDAPAVWSYAGLIERLKAMGVRHLYADYWTGERINLESREEVLAGDPNDQRNAGTLRQVQADPRACWLSTPGAQAERLGRAYGWTLTRFGTEVPGLTIPQVLACPP